ncbi:uncharacterized protein LOC101847097 [Aplysia californica]|uniref:Uncharacterized protein LOC101847097 n=1 Tax=Aplysia californica TaxID=6500 RepID=A0ABM0JJR6_APLCA|nr:uncharacterized protein LOC101847097 [Aplysia californica]
MVSGMQLFLCLVCLAMVHGTPYCTVGPGSGKSMPTMKEMSFRTEIAGKNIAKRYSVYIRETVDIDAKRQAAHWRSPQQDVTLITDGVKRQTIVVSNSACNVLNGDNYNGLQLNTNDGNNFFTTNDILQLGGNTTYVGNSTVRGIPVDFWTKCVTNAASNSTFTLTIYLSSPGWTMPGGLPAPIPIRYKMVGKKITNGTQEDINTIYDYFNFELLDKNRYEEEFQIPAGVFCPGLTSTQKPPTFTSSVVSYMSELSYDGHHGDSLLKVIYDTDDKLSREDNLNLYRDFYHRPSVYSSIRDYNEGVAYTISPDGSCTSFMFNQLAKLEGNDSLPYLDNGESTNQNGYIQMESVRAFFHADGDNFNYDSAVEVRGLKCDRFTKNYKALDNRDAQIQLYFTKNQTAQSFRPSSTQDVLIRKVTVDYYRKRIEDIYKFTNAPTVNQNPFDIRSCYNDTEKRNFRMEMKGTGYFTRENKYMLGSLLAQKLTGLVGISRARLHWDSIVEEKGVATIMGTLLDRGPDRDNYGKATGKTVDMTKLPISDQAKKTVRPSPGRPPIHSPQECARTCNQAGSGWYDPVRQCDSFDYCPGQCTFYWDHHDLDVQQNYYLKNTTGCDHYHKLVNVRPEPTLDEAWKAISDAVFNAEVSITIKSENRFSRPSVWSAYSIVDLKRVNYAGFPDSPLHTFDPLTVSDTQSGVAKIAMNEEECASACSNDLDMHCESFTYCIKLKKCLIRSAKPTTNVGTTVSDCQTYGRTYLSEFTKFPGKSVLSKKAVETFTQVTDPNDCARKCKQTKDFLCESFDLCTGGGTCALGKTHYYTAESTDVQDNATCTHYSLDYYFDYDYNFGKKVNNPSKVHVVKGIRPDSCAAQCSSGDIPCNTFYYCPSSQACLIPDPTASTSGSQLGHCDVFTLKKGIFTKSSQNSKQPATGGNPQGPKTSASTGNNGYSGGSMAGIAFGMIALGMALAVLGLFVAARFRTRPSAGPGISNITFSKDELKD